MSIGGGTGENSYDCEIDIDPFDVFKKAGGWYKCRKDSEGNRLSHLVGYTARDKFGRQLVGEEYMNFAVVEENINAIGYFALALRRKVQNRHIESWNTICAVPEGGKTLATMFASLYLGKKYIYPDKEVRPSEKQGERETPVFTFRRHRINPGDQVILVEDVVNNFTSVAKLCKLISDAGGRVIAIVSFFNRSETIENHFLTGVGGGAFIGGDTISVISLIRKKIRQYSQDYPFVSDDIKAGNVVWDPKKDWDKLAR